MTKGTKTREKIIRLAAEKAATEGLSQLTIGALANEIFMSKSGLFRHFGSKTALQMAVLESYTISFTEKVVRPALKEKGGLAKLETLIELALNWDAHIHRKSGCPIVAATTELDDQPGELRDYLQKQQADYIALIIGLAERTKREGHFRQDLDSERFAFEIYSHYLGFNFYKRMLESDQAEQLLRAAQANILDNAKV